MRSGVRFNRFGSKCMSSRPGFKAFGLWFMRSRAKGIRSLAGLVSLAAGFKSLVREVMGFAVEGMRLVAKGMKDGADLMRSGAFPLIVDSARVGEGA